MTIFQLRRIPAHLAQWALLCLTLAVLGGLLAHTLWKERTKAEQDVRERLLGHSHVMAQIISAELTALDKVLGALAEDWDGGQSGQDSRSGRDFNARLATLVEAMAGVRTLVVLDARGVCRASSRPELLGLDLSHRQYYKALRARPDRSLVSISPPFRTLLGVTAINVSRVLLGPDGAFAGVVAATLDTAYFLPLLASISNQPDIDAGVIHEKGEIFAMTPDTMGLTGRSLAMPGSFFTRHLDSGDEASFFTGRVMVSGLDRMLALRTVRPAGLRLDNALVVSISRDRAAVFGPANRSALANVGLYVATAALAVTAFAFFRRVQRIREREHDEAAGALEARERLIRGIIDSVPGLVAYWDSQLRCVHANQAYVEWFGRSPEGMRGVHIRELLGPELYARNEPFIMGALRGEPQRFERALTKTDGTVRHTMASYVPDVHQGRVQGFIAHVADVTELKLTQLELERRVTDLDRLAATDPLTGIGNRRSLFDQAAAELARAARYGQPLAFLMLDIDHFKAINDAHGHDAGDEVLRALAETLRETLRATDALGRVGGEEFAAVLVQTRGGEAEVIAERLRRRIEARPASTAQGPVAFTVSIGLASFPQSGETLEELMKHADEALYAAKAAGRNRVRRFEGAGAETTPPAAAPPAG